MPDWTQSMEQTFEYYIVDPGSWCDKAQLTDVIQSNIEWDSDADTLGSATFDMSSLLGECYIRVYLITIQNGIKEKFPMGTFLVQTPKSNFDGRYQKVSIDAYTPLLELKENPPPIGYSILKGGNVMSNTYKILRDNMRAPVVETTATDKLYNDFVASYTKAMGAYSHAEGGSTTASGDYSHAGGVGTIAKNDYQTVIGRYNANKNSAFIIGNGSSDTERSNALTVDWDGNITGKSLTSANDLKLGFGSSNIFKPYFTKGDSITLTIYAVGYVTTGGKEVAMYVPLSRPIIAGGSVSVASVHGLTIRQNGKYLYSSSASNSVNPSSFRAAIVGSGCGVNIVATFGNTVNATVNDVCSITASIKITFS